RARQVHQGPLPQGPRRSPELRPGPEPHPIHPRRERGAHHRGAAANASEEGVGEDQEVTAECGANEAAIAGDTVYCVAWASEHLPRLANAHKFSVREEI